MTLRIVGEARPNSFGLPELVVVVESPVSSQRRRQTFDAVLRRSPEVGAYNQIF
ncbi:MULTISPECIES: hypothetical protein [unclassified Mesorhizobium]|uniref:hypothetical protein n=1 Tax=unclassified Mesorhizobium TaxID=325217 RepID=UPI0015E40819|nr:MULTISPECIES: hypothetical protein [unclassified Mesorhizobium]MBZ9702532.1 hypothetical protein [Mesorhizobium sp. CO1-1-3]MBZ9918073.1 hypothetical protein [Mesorhizobium sp. BR1-1-7]MBZ9948751.1 hypothetical protein [Mesorhizobium sp. BR1-1-11]MBZ9951315.1 hypothetical protein [Mesorhizobium sp. BR1-1-15]MBZ9957502.1 hypothetical protein [Mesorhizobium sp. BR1-1-14]